MTEAGPQLDAQKATLVYSMFNHLGDFVVMGGLLKKFDQLEVPFASVIAHRGSPHVSLFDGDTPARFFDATDPARFLQLVDKLRRQKRDGHVVLGLPMAPGSLQAFAFFWLLKKLGALSYIVDFNLANADVITPPRRRYIFDRHLAQAAELFRRPDWLEDAAMPLAIATPATPPAHENVRVGFFPGSGRSQLPEFRWPVENWQELAAVLLQSSALEIVLLGQGDDFATFERHLRAGLAEPLQARVIAAPTQRVPELASALLDVDVLVTLNSSALHLAHALRLPTVALCGSTLETWLPEGPHIRLVRDERGSLPPSDQSRHDPLQPSVARIEVPPVCDAIQELMWALAGLSPA